MIGGRINKQKVVATAERAQESLNIVSRRLDWPNIDSAVASLQQITTDQVFQSIN
jgi:hypothetical protein